MRYLAPLLLAALLAAAATAAEPPADPWLRATAHLDRAVLVRGEAFRVAVVLDLDKGYHVNANPPSLGFQIPTVVTPEPTATFRWGDVTYPRGEPFAAAWSEGKSILVYGGRATLVVPGTVAADAPLGDAVLRLKLDYQGCDANTCYQPGSRAVEVAAKIAEAGTPSAPANAELFAEAAKPPAAPAPAPAAGTATGQPIRFEGQTDLAATFERGLFLYLGALFLGGLLLNLTPCVFPLIPITMSVFAQQGESRTLKVLPLAILYVLGLATTFTIVGVLAALAGQSLGVVLQQPVGVLAVVVILAAMMASMFGAFEIRLPAGLMGRLSARRGHLGAVFMGMVMGAIAAPCVGPFLFALITFIATERSVPLGAVSFFVTGLGIGLPYLFLGVFTGQINRFPRGGWWLVWTKQLMGLALGGLILYYIQRFIAPEFFWPLVLALFIFSALYLGVLEGWGRRPFTRRFQTVRLTTGVAILAAGIAVYAWGTAARPEVAWQPWTPDTMSVARSANRPTLLYFGADWCVECKEWHASVFTDPAVVAESAKFTPVYVDVTRLEEGPKKEFAARFQAVNPPVVVVMDAAGKVVAAYRSPPDPGKFVETMRQARGP